MRSNFEDFVGRHDILPCAAPFKSLQGLGVPFSFLSFK